MEKKGRERRRPRDGAGVAIATVSVGMMAVMSQVNAFGTSYAAGYNVGNKLDSMAFLPVQAMAPATVLYFSCGEPSVPIQLFFYAVGAVAILKHRSNIQRLLAGTEQKFVRSPRPGKEEK